MWYIRQFDIGALVPATPWGTGSCPCGGSGGPAKCDWYFQAQKPLLDKGRNNFQTWTTQEFTSVRKINNNEAIVVRIRNIVYVLDFIYKKGSLCFQVLVQL